MEVEATFSRRYMDVVITAVLLSSAFVFPSIKRMKRHLAIMAQVGLGPSLCHNDIVDHTRI